MSNTEPQPTTKAEYKAAIEAMLAEMAEIDERIARQQDETRRSQARTQEILDRLLGR